MNWALAAAICVLAGLVYHLDEPIAESIHSLSDAQKQAQAEARRERAATQLCVRLHGLGVSHSWDADGRLVCKARRGNGQTIVAAGAV